MVTRCIVSGPLPIRVAPFTGAVTLPLGRLGAKTYRVTGPWKDPKVEVISREQSRLSAARGTDGTG